MATLTRKATLPTCMVLLLALAVVMLSAAGLGAVHIPLPVLFSGALTEQQEAVLYSIRIPRILLAGLVGSALAVSGAAMQGLFRNPLADPGLIGIASGAALAVALTIVVLEPIADAAGIYSLSMAAFIGGVGSCLLVFRFAQLTGSFSVTYMLLAGIAINALAGAGTGFMAFISNDQQLRALTFWTMGSLGGALWPSVFVAANIIVPASILLVRYGRQLNILLLGEEEARHLGVDSEKVKYVIVLCTALCVGAAVAVSGIIGFVGLIVPHLIRLTLGPDHRLLIPASALLGALLLVAADSIARMVVAPAEMPVGILTSLIGGPFFLWLLMKQYSGRYGV